MNHLYYGDNLDVLRRHVANESVDLCYIDPPFNSKRNYNQIYNNVGREDLAQAQAFIDTWVWDELATQGFREIVQNDRGLFTVQAINLVLGLEKVLGMGSLFAYLISLTLRVAEIHRVLKPTGSFYLHCDPTSSHYLKLVLDSIFCPQGGDFKNEIIWKRTSARNDAKRWGNVHDVIFFYTKSSVYTWNPIYEPYSDDYLKTKYRYKDSRGTYRLDNLTGAGVTKQGDSSKAWHDYDPTPIGRHWAVPQKIIESLVGKDKTSQMTTQEKLDFLDQHDYIYWTPKGRKGGVGFPQYKRYLTGGLTIQDMIADISPINSQAMERLGYPTQKPVALLERILQASSNEGDIVLDAYCGCGTTVAAAQKLNRQWIGIDITYQAISLIVKRLEDEFGSQALDQIKLTGIPKDMRSAIALANQKDDRTRKEFEKWAVLSYSRNRAVINQKKGADQGIDGTAFFLKSESGHGRIIFQIKSGNVGSKDIRDLYGTMGREKAELGIFITLKEPTSAMTSEAKQYGLYHHEVMGRDYPCVQIVTIREILEENKRLEVPLSMEVLKSAKRQHSDQQLNILSPLPDLDFMARAVGE